MNRWLVSGFTGCGFAQSFAVKGRLTLGAFGPDDAPDKIDALFDFAAGQQLPALAIFPEIRNGHQLLDQLRLLATGGRWVWSREAVEGLATDDVLVGVRWRTAQGLTALPMGFGPFASMPVTRRAPYTCLATWPGGHENPHRKKFDLETIDFLDSVLPEPWDAAGYKAVWNSSIERTSELLSEPADSASYYRKVAFRLSAAVAGRF